LEKVGGDPLVEDGVLRPIYQKYYEEVLGLDNPAGSATAIPVRNIDISIYEFLKCKIRF
jgi:hypothetical protein